MARTFMYVCIIDIAWELVYLVNFYLNGVSKYAHRTNNVKLYDSQFANRYDTAQYPNSSTYSPKCIYLLWVLEFQQSHNDLWLVKHYRKALTTNFYNIYKHFISFSESLHALKVSNRYLINIKYDQLCTYLHAHEQSWTGQNAVRWILRIMQSFTFCMSDHRSLKLYF